MVKFIKNWICNRRHGKHWVVFQNYIRSEGLVYCMECKRKVTSWSIDNHDR